MALDWKGILGVAQQGNPEPAQRVTKTDSEWRAQLTPEQYRVTRQHGTERPFSSPLCSLFEAGRYACMCCGTVLFDAAEKFESGTGWPSFTQPVAVDAVAYYVDHSHGMTRVEVRCNTCDAHLGHVFPDGPAPTGLRYCINAVSLQKVATALATATFGGGCFWCTEAIFREVDGVVNVTSGYSGGHLPNPDYRNVCTGKTGHAEVIQIQFDPAVISYADLLAIHMATHDPTTLNQQDADKGTQYRSVIFFHDETQRQTAAQTLAALQPAFGGKIVTELAPLEAFYPAESYHQDYYRRNTDAPYCQFVIAPKLRKFREKFGRKT